MELTHILDRSAHARLHEPTVSTAVAQILAQGGLACSLALALEVGWSARNASEHRSALPQTRRLAELLPLSLAACELAISLQEELARRGQHRGPGIADLMTAALAQERHLIVLHYDRDFEVIERAGGPAQQWVVAPGSVD